MRLVIMLCGNPVVRAFGWSLLNLVWEGAAVAGLLFVLLKILSGRSAELRYGLACSALALMIALPLATFVYLLLSTDSLPSSVMNPAGLGIPMVYHPINFGRTDTWAETVTATLDRALPWLLMAWSAGVTIFLGKLNLGLMLARRMTSSGTHAVTCELQCTLTELKAKLGVARPVRLLQSTMVQVPTVIGWLRPVILIPIGCLAGMSPTQVGAILAHELAHIRRHDYLVSVLQSFAEAMLFYHPAVWWVSKQVRAEREDCCDDLAVGISGDSLAYARALSLLEEQRSNYPIVSLGANGGALVMRIGRLLGYKEAPAFSRIAGMMLLAGIVAGIGLGVGALAHGQAAAEKNSSAVQATGMQEEMPTVYQKWIDEDVRGIITTEEEKEFMKLENNHDRDEFILRFWERRDQETPGGSRDAFRKEYYRRIAYANLHFATGEVGWRSDRGRIYILYGPPYSIDSHPGDGDGGPKPFEVWHYNVIQASPDSAPRSQGEAPMPNGKKDVDMKFIDTCSCGNYQLQAWPK